MSPISQQVKPLVDTSVEKLNETQKLEAQAKMDSLVKRTTDAETQLGNAGKTISALVESMASVVAENLSSEAPEGYDKSAALNEVRGLLLAEEALRQAEQAFANAQKDLQTKTTAGMYSRIESILGQVALVRSLDVQVEKYKKQIAEFELPKPISLDV